MLRRTSPKRRRVHTSVWVAVSLLVFVVSVRSAMALTIRGGDGSGGNYASGLITAWKMDGDGSDSGPNGLNLTTANVTPVADDTGTAGRALAFNGTTSYMSAPGSPLINSADFGDRTILIRFKVNSANSTESLYEEGDGTNDVHLYVSNDSGTVNLHAVAIGTSWGQYDAYGSLSVGSWHTAAVVFEAGQPLALYIDNTATSGSNKQGSTQTFKPHEQAVIGASLNNYVLTNGPATATGYSNFLDGVIADLALYSYPMSLSGVQSYFAASAPTSGPPLTIGKGLKGLVGQWKLDGNAKDATPYSDNGVVNGATLVADRRGTASSAYSFNGSSYISVPNAAILQQTGDMSISFWATVTNNGNYGALVSKGPSGEYELAADFRSGGSALAWQAAGAGVSLSDYFAGYTGVPVFVTVTVSGNTLTAYRNGLLFGTTTIGARTASANNLMIGCRPTLDYCATAQIDDVRIYNRPLATDDVVGLSGSYRSEVRLSGQ